MNKRLLIIIAAGVVLLGGLGAGAYFLFFSGGEEAEEATEVVEEQLPAGLIELDTFIVNLDDVQEDRFVKVQLSLTVAPEERAMEIAGNDLIIARARDRILTLLASKNYEELATPLGKEALRREIKARVSPLLDGDEVQDVLFKDFLVQ